MNKQNTQLLDAAEKYYPLHPNDRAFDHLTKVFREAYIKGALSDAARDYWFAQFKQSQVGAGVWVKASERLPETLKDVQLLLSNGKQCVGFYTKGGEQEFMNHLGEEEDLGIGWYELEETPQGDYEETFVVRNPTHWQPLPKTPISAEGLKEK